MADSPRVLVIGLDGATYNILQPLAELGYLPHLWEIVETGSWGRLESTIPPFTGAAWSTFATGQNPGQHGILTFRTRDRYNYDTKGSGFVDASRFGQTLWETIGSEGRKVIVVNVPLTYPPRAVNGLMVTGMLTPPGSANYTYPASLKEALGDNYVIDVDFVRKGDGFREEGFPSKAVMLPQIKEMSRIRGKISLELMKENPWDFFMVVFTSTDRVSHFFWDDLERLVVEDTGSDGRNVEDLLAYFSELDEMIGALVESAGEETRVILMSDHGFGHSPRKRAFLNIWLEQNGLLKKRDAEGLMDLEFWRVRLGRNRRLKKLIRWLLPESTQHSVKKTTESRSKDIIDWSLTKAYWVPIYFHVCGIEVNTAENHREGNVLPGKEYERIRQQVIDAAGQMTDPESGERMVELAARREDLFHGPHVENFPDVILVLKADYIGAGSLAGALLAEPFTAARPGEHRSDGIFAAKGPAILNQGPLEGLRLLDLPATVLYMMDLPIPRHYDSQVLTGLFDKDYLQAHPIRLGEVTPADRSQSTETHRLSAEEEAQLEERLRGLGYIE